MMEFEIWNLEFKMKTIVRGKRFYSSLKRFIVGYIFDTRVAEALTQKFTYFLYLLQLV